MVKLIERVSDNLVFVYFTDRPKLTISTNDGSAYSKALELARLLKAAAQHRKARAA